VVLQRLALAREPHRVAGPGPGVAFAAEVGVRRPVLVADLEALLAVQFADDLPVVAGPVQRGLVVGAPVVHRAAHVQRAVGERVRAAFGGEGGGGGEGEREQGGERS